VPYPVVRTGLANSTPAVLLALEDDTYSCVEGVPTVQVNSQRPVLLAYDILIVLTEVRVTG